MTPEAQVERDQKAALEADAAQRSLAAPRSAAQVTNGKPNEDGSERERAHDGGRPGRLDSR